MKKIEKVVRCLLSILIYGIFLTVCECIYHRWHWTEVYALVMAACGIAVAVVAPRKEENDKSGNGKEE